MQGKLLVATSFFAGASCCVRTWIDWSGDQPLSVGEHVHLLFSYAFWEAVLSASSAAVSGGVTKSGKLFDTLYSHRGRVYHSEISIVYEHVFHLLFGHPLRTPREAFEAPLQRLLGKCRGRRRRA